MDHGVTCEEFEAFLLATADQMRLEWAAGVIDAPQIYPQTMSLEDWWHHFREVAMPEQLLASSTRAVKPHDQSRAA
jgi:hypothetical protein